MQTDAAYRDDCAKLAFQNLLAIASAMSAQKGGVQINMTAISAESFRAARAMVEARNEADQTEKNLTPAPASE